MSNIILMLHATTGVLFILTAVWTYVDALNVTEASVARVRAAGKLAALLMWLTIIIGGYWYIYFYGADKAVILKGPWPVAHDFFMETKEHVLLFLLILATFLPIATANDLVKVPAAKRLVLWVSGLCALAGLGMEGAGAIISMGAKLGLMIAK
jgi:hypothetical protein